MVASEVVLRSQTGEGSEQCTRDGPTHLAEGVRELCIKVIYNGSNLAFESQLVATLKVQSRGIDYSEGQAIELRLANLDGDRLNDVRVSRCALQERVDGGSLFVRGCRGDLRGLEEQPEQRCFACSLSSGDL